MIREVYPESRNLIFSIPNPGVKKAMNSEYEYEYATAPRRPNLGETSSKIRVGKATILREGFRYLFCHRRIVCILVLATVKIVILDKFIVRSVEIKLFIGSELSTLHDMAYFALKYQQDLLAHTCLLMNKLLAFLTHNGLLWADHQIVETKSLPVKF
jgi:hypothetical protein